MLLSLGLRIFYKQGNKFLKIRKFLHHQKFPSHFFQQHAFCYLELFLYFFLFSVAASMQDLIGRKHNGVLRMLPQSRVIRSIGDLNPANGGAFSIPLDLSGGKENGTSDGRSESPKSDGSSANNAGEISSSRRRRKGPAFKIDAAIRQRLQDPTTEEEETNFGNGDIKMDESDEKCPIIQPESPPVAFNHAAAEYRNGETIPNPKSAMLNGGSKRTHDATSTVITTLNGGAKHVKREFSCEYCAMGFEDSTMYTMHMGFHGRDDPYNCALCGHSAGDRVSFFLHIAKAAHS